MQERKRKAVKRKNPLFRIAVLLVPLVVLLLTQTVFAQNTYVITDGSRVLVYTSSATDPAAVLTEAGLALGADDTYTTQTGIGVSEITVQRSRTVTVDNCGEIMEVSAEDETVSDLLQRLSVSLEGNAVVSVPMEMEVFDGMEITVYRTMQEVQSYTTSIPYTVTYCLDNTLPAGMERVITEGVDGQMLCSANVVYVNGREVERTVLEETVLNQPVNEIIAVGNAVEEVQTVFPAEELVIENGHIYLPSGEVLSYTGSMQVVATAYSHLDPGCDFYTATNTRVHIGSVAVDPRVIPLGTRMFIVSNDGCYVYGISTAEDTGSSIKENKIDLYFPTQELCMQFGRRNVTVYFLG